MTSTDATGTRVAGEGTVRRALRRIRKRGREAWVRAVSARRPKTAVFVWGCHRSGTTMLLRLFRRSPWCAVYHENNERAMREHSRLRDDETIRRLIRDEARPIVVFKPLNDAQYARRHLAIHEPAKGVWIYRAYPDVVNSTVERWGPAQRNIYLSIALRRAGDAGAELTEDGHSTIYEENLSDASLSVIERYAHPEMSDSDAAALHWYLRNRLYFDLGLDTDARVELVRYEDLVLDPNRYLRRVFDFLGCTYRSAWANGIFRSSIDKRPAPAIDADIEALCDELLERLELEYGRRVARPPSGLAAAGASADRVPEKAPC